MLVKSSASHHLTSSTVGAPAHVRLLEQNGPGASFEARVSSANGKVLELLGNTSLAAGSAVRIDVEGGMVLGEVIYSKHQPSGCVVRVQIDQVIPSVSELAKLIARVMGHPSPASHPDSAPAPVHRDDL